MDHPNIVRLHEFYDEKNVYCLVQEIVTGGELFDHILKQKLFSEGNARVLVKRLLSAINYCHCKGIVHRDLKPENILLEENLDFGNMKIIDFGTACGFDEKGQRRLTEMLGTPYYIAPEVLQGQYNEKCDIWSIGVICYMLLCGKAPFYGKDDEAIYASVARAELSFGREAWKRVTPDAKEFIQLLLTKDYSKRPTAQQCLDHKWMSMAKESVDETHALEVLGHLSKFRATETLKMATYSFMASQLVSKGEKEKLAGMFKAFDKNGDGKLDKLEIQSGYEQ